LGEIHWLTFAIGAGGIVALIGLKKWKPMFPGALVVVVLGTLITWGFRLDQSGVAIVNSVPAGLPGFKLPVVTWARVQQMLPIALTIAMVGFMESISVAKAFASRNRYQVDANQELVALGVANLGGAIFQSYPVTGGFSRTAVNGQAGAKTTMSSMISALIVVVALLFMTPLFTFLPKALLASIVLVAVMGLVDYKEPIKLWKVKRKDAYALLVSFAVTLFVGIEQGILVGVVVSMLLFIYRSTRPHTAILGRLPGTDIFRNVEHYPDSETDPRYVVLRVDASFYFANVSFFRDQVNTCVNEAGDALEAVILDMSGTNDIDSSADHALHELAHDLKENGIALYFAQAKGPVREVFDASGMVKLVGEEQMTMTIQDAIDSVLSKKKETSDDVSTSKEQGDDGPAEKATTSVAQPLVTREA
jgi:SulP family sulfate permease